MATSPPLFYRSESCHTANQDISSRRGGVLTEEYSDPFDWRIPSDGVPKGTEILGRFGVTDNHILCTKGEIGVSFALDVDAIVSCLCGRCDVDSLSILEFAKNGLPDARIEAVIIAEVIVVSRQTSVMLDQSVMPVQIIQIEGEPKLVIRGEDSDRANGDGKVDSDVQSLTDAFGQGWKIHSPAIARKYAVVCETVQSGTWPTN